MQRHDRVATAEKRRRHARNLVQTSDFEGCRCCYDPNNDGGGDYAALIEFKERKRQDEEDGKLEIGYCMPIGGVDQLPVQTAETPTDSESNSDDSDSEFDYLLDDDDLPGASANKQWEEARKAELEYQIWTNQVAMQHGFGVHRQLHPSRVLKVAGIRAGSSSSSLRSPPSAVVLHLFDPDSLSSASLDYYIERDVAPTNMGTMFLRAHGRATLQWNADSPRMKSTMLGQLRPDRDLPCLIAIRDGVAVNNCPNLREFSCSRYEDGEIEKHAVNCWLNQSGALIHRAPPVESLCNVRPEEDALMAYLEAGNQSKSKTEKKAGPEFDFYCCGVEGCQKTFPHEHVGIETSQQSGLVVNEETVLGTGE